MSGLVTQVLIEGDSEVSPDANDFVAIHYIGWTPAGQKFESSYDKGEPARFGIEAIFPGWQEGVQLMKVGERRRMWIPAHMTPPNPQVGPQGKVIFDVELLDVLALPNRPETVKVAPEDARMTSYGASYRVIKDPGEEAETAKPNHIGALVHWTLWTQNGKMKDSSIPRGRPTLFPFDKVMPAFGDVIKGMKVGETGHLWVPANIAAGDWPGSPRGPLTFELELVSFVDSSVLGGTGG